MGTHYRGTKEDRLTLDAFIKLTRASESLNRRLNQHLAEADLTVSQFGVLEAIYHLGPLNQKALCDKLLKTGGNITMVVDNLEKCHLVERQQNPDDRRSMLVHLTSRGEDFISSFFPEHLENIRQEFADLSSEEKKELARICKKLGIKKEQ
ncbi:MAG TPA: MarR family transcriptional regulator [Balneolaceae bacterium]|nr:MarR family transcriptional regulator [Balneolaceae bacterium]